MNYPYLTITQLPKVHPLYILYEIRVSMNHGRYYVNEFLLQIFQFYQDNVEHYEWGQIRWSVTQGLGGTIGSTRRNARLTFEQFENRLNDLTTSNMTVNITDLTFFVEFKQPLPIIFINDDPLPIHGGDHLNNDIKGVLKINGGPKGYCFIYALLLAFRNDKSALQKFTTWKSPREIGLKKMLSFIYRRTDICDSLYLLVGKPQSCLEYFEKVVKIFQNYLIIVYKGGNRSIKYVARGELFNKQKKYTLFLNEHTNLHSSHVNYITNINLFLSFNGTVCNHLFCYDCYERFPSVAKSTNGSFNVVNNNIENHNCEGILKCKSCFRTDCIKGVIKQCYNCLVTCQSEECYKIHTEDTSKRYCIVARTQCGYCSKIINKRDFKNHDCANVFCQTCKHILPIDHECYNKQAFPNFVKHTPTSRTSIEYLFADIECCTKQSEPMKTTIIDPVTMERVEVMATRDFHYVNYIYMQDTEENEWEFNSAEEFINWAVNLNLTSSIKIYFHNGGKYDIRLIFDAWINMFDNFPKVFWNGQKILKMTMSPYDAEEGKGDVSLFDSIYHISMPLANFSKTFNLPINKGFFPHKFHTFENQFYIGEIPSKELFPIYDGKELEEFNEWHDNFKGEYNLRNEMITYCKMDVELLRKGCMIYRQAGLDSQVNPKFSKIDPFWKLTIAGYCHNVYQVQHYKSRTIENITKDDKFYNLIRESFHGGDTNSTNLLKVLTDEEVSQGHKIMYVDKVSMYPDIMVNCEMPVGKPLHVVTEGIFMNEEEILKIFGFLRVDYKVIKYIHHPIPKLIKDERLVSDLYDYEKVSLTSIEIKAMLESKCYKITKVWEYLHYENKSQDLFKSYMNTCVGGKTLSSHDPTPKDEEEALNLYNHTNGAIDIRGKKFENNPGLRAIYKLMCNSLWGKFGEKEDRERIGVVNMETFNKIFEDVMEGTVDINAKEFHPRNRDLVMVRLSGEDRDKHFENPFGESTTNLKNIGIASFITAYGRLALNEMKQKLNSRSFYNDTDSIIYHYIPGKFEIPLGTLLGQWSNELKEGFIDKFVSTGPKSYSYRNIYNPQEYNSEIFDPEKYVRRNNLMYKYKCVCKSKGINLSKDEIKDINIDSMCELVRGTIHRLNTKTLKFEWKRNGVNMHTYFQEKVLSMTYKKGFINSKFQVLPFGYEKFIYEHDDMYYSKDNLLIDF